MSSVDVIIPILNGAAYIGPCLDSVLAQTHPVSTIWVCDDGSTDNSVAVVEDYAARYPQIKVLNEAHKGVSAARNRALAKSRADFIAFIDADDLWHPEKIERQLAVFAAGGARVGAVHCHYCHISADGSARPHDHTVPPKKRGNIFFDMLFYDYVLSGSAAAAIVRKSVLDEVGYFNEQLFLGEDADLWFRIAEKYDWDYCAEVLCSIRVHDQSAQRRPDPRDWKYLFQRLRLYHPWYGRIPFPPHVQERLRAEAVRVLAKRWFNPLAIVRLYRQLKSSDMPLARNLFSSASDYCLSLLPVLFQLVRDKARGQAYRILKHYGYR